MNNHPDKKETIKETFKRIFSLKEDKASNRKYDCGCWMGSMSS